MRTIKSLLLVLAITFSSVLSANTEKEPVNSQSVAKEVAKRLKNPDFKLDKEVLVFVKFTLNDDNEMVVLSVDSDKKIIDSYIKNRLNYVKLKSKPKTGIKTFVVSVKMVPNA